MRPLSFFLKNPSQIFLWIFDHYGTWLPDEIFLKIRFRLEMGKSLNLKNPKTFQEKIQWLKLYDRRPEYVEMVDKYAVKGYVSKRIGDKYIIPTLGVWKSFDEIDFDSLPSKFVLKTTHGGGSSGVVICRDKSKFNRNEAKSRLESSLSADIYRHMREWPYKNVPRRIIAEEFLEIKGGAENYEIKDYKFFCFDGKPEFFKVDFGRFSEHHANYYDLNWNLLPFGELDYPPLKSHIEEKPANFDEMVEIAKKLSAGHKFLRVDLYNIMGRIYFGELTFYPASGFGKFTNREWEFRVGDLLHLKES